MYIFLYIYACIHSYRECRYLHSLVGFYTYRNMYKFVYRICMFHMFECAFVSVYIKPACGWLSAILPTIKLNLLLMCFVNVCLCVCICLYTVCFKQGLAYIYIYNCCFYLMSRDN